VSAASAVRLHQALGRAPVPNQILTVPGGQHGGFSGAEVQRAFRAIREFLAAKKSGSLRP